MFKQLHRYVSLNAYKTVLERENVTKKKTLTSNLQRGIPANHRPRYVFRHAPVHAPVLLLLAVDGAQEEQGSGRQQHPVGLVVGGRRPHRLSVLVPLDAGLGPALGLAVQGDGLVFGHYDVGGVLRYAGRAVLS